MSTRTDLSPTRSGADATVSGIQHVGHVVRDIDGAIALYRRMGFVVPPPSFQRLLCIQESHCTPWGGAIRRSALRRSHSNWSRGPTIATRSGERKGHLDPCRRAEPCWRDVTDSIGETATRIPHALARFQACTF